MFNNNCPDCCNKAKSTKFRTKTALPGGTDHKSLAALAGNAGTALDSGFIRICAAWVCLLVFSSQE